MTDEFLEALQEVDSSLHTEVFADIQKELKQEMNRYKSPSSSRDADSAKAYDQVLQKWIEQKSTNLTAVIGRGASGDRSANKQLEELIGGTFIGSNAANGTDIMRDLEAMSRNALRIPSALPLNMLPLILRNPEIAKEDLEVLTKTVFTSDLFNGSISVDSSGFLTSYRGKPAVSIEATLEQVQRRIASLPSLDDRVRVMLLPEYPQPNPANTLIEKYSGTSFEPVFLVLSKAAAPKSQGGVEYGLGVATFLASIVTTFIYATDLNSFNSNFLQLALAGDETVISRVFTILGGVFALQVLHDLGEVTWAVLCT
jgi:hypothetical protein